MRIELDRVLRIRSADGPRLSGLSQAGHGAVDRGGRRDSSALADPRRVRARRSDDAQQARHAQRLAVACGSASRVRLPGAVRHRRERHRRRRRRLGPRSSRRSTSRCATSSISRRSSRAGVRAAKRAARRISPASVSAARTRSFMRSSFPFAVTAMALQTFSTWSPMRPARAPTQRPISPPLRVRASPRRSGRVARAPCRPCSSGRRKPSAMGTRWAKLV